MKLKRRVIPTSAVGPTDSSHTGVGVITEGTGGVGVVIEGVPETRPPAKPPIIGMFVRRDDTADPKIKARTISLRPIPDRASLDDLFTIGFGFDGDTVTVGVTAKSCVRWRGPQPTPSAYGAMSNSADPKALPSIEPLDESDPPRTLSEALNEVQAALVHWLRRLGYEVRIA